MNSISFAIRYTRFASFQASITAIELRACELQQCRISGFPARYRANAGLCNGSRQLLTTTPEEETERPKPEWAQDARILVGQWPAGWQIVSQSFLYNRSSHVRRQSRLDLAQPHVSANGFSAMLSLVQVIKSCIEESSLLSTDGLAALTIAPHTALSTQG